MRKVGSHVDFSDKFPPVMVGTSAKPQCFKKCKNTCHVFRRAMCMRMDDCRFVCHAVEGFGQQNHER